MYETSKKWKQNIYENTVCAMNIYIDDVLVNPDYILDFKKGGNAFEEEFCLGGTPSQYVEMKLYKDKMPESLKKIRVEYGILINHALTVAEVNAMLVGTLNGIPVKSLSSNDSSFEMIPIGIYNVDDYTDNDDNTITIKALDNMIKFEFNYDGRELISKGEATLLEVAQDICKKAGVELNSTSFLNSDKKVAVCDNTVTARKYISYIAESAGGFACIDRKGKLCFRKFYQDETEIPLEIFGEYKWGEEFKISKVSYEDGIRSFKFGDDTRNNLWINQENMYIVDEDQVQKIYNEIKDLTSNTFEGKTVIDPAIDLGDKIVIDGKNVIYQGEMSLEGSFIAQISSKIQIKQKEETTVKKESQKVVNRKVQSRIDQAEGKITQLIQETSDVAEKANRIDSTVEGTTQTISSLNASLEGVLGTINELKTTIEGLKNTLKTQGGSNLLRNSVGIFGKEYWEGSITQYQDTDVFQNNISKSAIMLPNGNILQTVNPLKNGTYNISFNYKKRVQAAVVKVSINGIEETLTETSWTAYEKTIKITNNKFTIKFISDTANSCLISDLILIPGESKNTWSQNINETSSETVQIGEGIQVESTKTNTYTRIDSDGNRTFNKSSNEVVTEQTDKGTTTNDLTVRTQAQITGLLQQQHGDQVWVNVL